jgi:hypothetical protein
VGKWHRIGFTGLGVNPDNLYTLGTIGFIAIPEPGRAGLLLLGLLITLAKSRRRQSLSKQNQPHAEALPAQGGAVSPGASSTHACEG